MINHHYKPMADIILNSYIEGVYTRCHLYTKRYKREDYHAKRL